VHYGVYHDMNSSVVVDLKVGGVVLLITSGWICAHYTQGICAAAGSS
jgi:hypothetical protein